MARPLTQEEIAELFVPREIAGEGSASTTPIPGLTAGGFVVPSQSGPLRRFDTEMRCASKRCGSSTYLKVRGIPYCSTHALNKLNELLINLGVEK